MILRPYQSEAEEAVYRHLRTRDDNPVVVIPTGGGKTPVIASICDKAVNQWGGRVLILAHVKELLAQAANKLAAVCPNVEVGIYSAGLGRKELGKQVTVAGIQSLYRKACDLGKVDLVLVDECHLIPLDGDGMYRSFLDEMHVVNPDVRVVGFTATPFRMGVGPVCSDDHFLNQVCYEISPRQLIADGYLSPIIAKAGQSGRVDFTAIPKRGGEFVEHDAQLAMDREDITREAVAEIVSLTADRKSVLIFTTGVSHANHVKQEIERITGEECGAIFGDTPATEREETIARFTGEKHGMFSRPRLRFLVNVNVLTTGFDAPCVDCVVLLRPTGSPGLYYQMVGRGFRLNPGKDNCLVLDYGGNALRHGPVDKLNQPKQPTRGKGEGEAPAKECPKCHSVVALSCVVCADCGHEFPPGEEKLTAFSAGVPVLSGEITDDILPVESTDYAVHYKKGDANAPPTMRVIYRVSAWESHSEWVCIEHKGWARKTAEKWWKARSEHPVPTTAKEATELANAGVLADPVKITLRSISGEKWPKVLSVECGPMPDPYLKPIDLEDVPF